MRKRIVSKLFLFLMGLGLFSSNLISEEKSCEEVFSYVYENYVWGKAEDGDPSSGFGSHIQYAASYVEFLSQFIKDHQIQSVVDLGCGAWEFARYMDWENIDYIGVEVAQQVVALNQQKFGSDHIQFISGDILTMDLPDGELMVCKDVLQHLQDEDILLFLSKIKKYKHCLITNDIAISLTDNVEITKKNRQNSSRGSNRPIDLTLPPFNVKGTKIFTYPIGNHIGCHIKQVLYINNSD